MGSATASPLIVQSDLTLLLEVQSPLFEQARAAIAPFAEIVKSPEYIHTYRITDAIQIAGKFGSRQEEAQRLGSILRPKEDGTAAFTWSHVNGRFARACLIEYVATILKKYTFFVPEKQLIVLEELENIFSKQVKKFGFVLASKK